MIIKQTESLICFEFGTIELKNGILVQCYHKNTIVDLDKVYLMEAAIETLTKKKKIPFLFLGKEGVEPTLEARKYSSSEKANKYISAIAIVIEKGNLAHKIFGNILLTIDKRPNPIKIFTTENKAISWLSKY